MPDYTLVPVDYQPDFSDYSLVPVDYDPFAPKVVVEQAQPQPGGTPQQSASGVAQPDVVPPINNLSPVAFGESYDGDVTPANGIPASRDPSAGPIFPVEKSSAASDQYNGQIGAQFPVPDQSRL